MPLKVNFAPLGSPTVKWFNEAMLMFRADGSFARLLVGGAT